MKKRKMEIENRSFNLMLKKGKALIQKPRTVLYILETFSGDFDSSESFWENLGNLSFVEVFLRF